MSSFDAELNQSLIALIPKALTPENVSQLRPITLCNVIVKVFAKVVANRLKPLMLKLTSTNQYSFFPGRQASNNIIVAQELLHIMRKKEGKCGFLVVKIDLEKAYDQIN